MLYMRILPIVMVLFSLGLQACSNPSSSSPPVLADIHETTFAEQSIRAGNLGGLYISAGDNTPITLIVPGSGAVDLNGNIGANMRTNAYKYLAQQLAAKSVSSVRVDKRGLHSSAKAGNPNAVTVDIYAQDYRNWIDTIKQKTGAKCVYLLGHSEGGLMVSRAAIGRSDVCGLILVSAPGRPLGTVLREQIKSNPANFLIRKQAFAAITKLEAGEKVNTENMNPALLGLFRDSVQDYWISLMAVDPAQVAAQAKKKTLIVQGGNDFQVSVKDAELLAEATGGELVVLGKVNHILKMPQRIGAAI